MIKMKTMLLAIFISLPSFTSACTVALIKTNNAFIIAHNLDWPYVEGIGIIHPRHESHVADVDPNKYTALSWTSRYGSVVFHGRDEINHKYPAADGLNEEGLFASVLILKHSRYAINNKLPTLDTGQWVDYLLDNFSSVDEVIHDMKDVQFVANHYKGHALNLHMFIADKIGNSAVLEYVNGERLLYQGNTLSQLLLANDTYEDAISNLKEYSGFGGSKTLPGGYGSQARFVRAASFLKRIPPILPASDSVSIAFDLLSDVSEAPFTAIQTIISDVYDIKNKKIFYRSIYNANVRAINLSEIDFEHLDSPIYFSIHDKEAEGLGES